MKKGNVFTNDRKRIKCSQMIEKDKVYTHARKR